MKIKKPGKVTDRIFLLGCEEFCIYILKGDQEYTLIGGGIAYIISDVIQQLREFGIEEAKITRMIILHSHFDHCGIIPFLKKRWPWAKVTASVRAKELLADPKIVKHIASLNQDFTNYYKQKNKSLQPDFIFTEIEVEEVIKGGDMLCCGDLILEVIDTPGHSSCSIAIYVPRLKALFASDAGGIPCGEQIFTAANSNFDNYQLSLEKIVAYDVETFMAEHFGALIGEDGRNFLKKSINAAKKMRSTLEKSYNHTMDVQKSTEEITNLIMREAPRNFLPRKMINMVVAQMLKNIAKIQA